jgi:hypothetical protein
VTFVFYCLLKHGFGLQVEQTETIQRAHAAVVVVVIATIKRSCSHYKENIILAVANQLGRSFAVNRLLAQANPHHTSRTHPVAKKQIFSGVLFFFLKTDLSVCDVTASVARLGVMSVRASAGGNRRNPVLSYPTVGAVQFLVGASSAFGARKYFFF